MLSAVQAQRHYAFALEKWRSAESSTQDRKVDEMFPGKQQGIPSAAMRRSPRQTFRAFFGLERPKGYLCYSAVGIPENEYAYVTRSLARVFTKYEAYVVGDSGIHLFI
jgi:hypothetical protein